MFAVWSSEFAVCCRIDVFVRVVRWLLFVVWCVLCAVCCLVFVACWLLLVVRCVMFAVC